MKRSNELKIIFKNLKFNIILKISNLIILIFLLSLLILVEHVINIDFLNFELKKLAIKNKFFSTPPPSMEGIKITKLVFFDMKVI